MVVWNSVSLQLTWSIDCAQSFTRTESADTKMITIIVVIITGRPLLLQMICDKVILDTCVLVCCRTHTCTHGAAVNDIVIAFKVQSVHGAMLTTLLSLALNYAWQLTSCRAVDHGGGGR